MGAIAHRPTLQGRFSGTRNEEISHPRNASSPHVQETPSRTMGWWLPPPRDDGDYGEGNVYVSKILLGEGHRFKYDVRLEGREVVITGKAVEATDTSRAEYSYERRHRLPDEIDLNTVKTKVTSNGNIVVVTAKFKQ
ncbi:hypothetical protein J6590_051894 [Homalodisca vitripennis]|nr:hypothetical protein J6590_051894 [Homalodisca vitripennis]